MTYILIFIFAYYDGKAETSTGSAEFRSLGACQAAAKELRRQTIEARAKVPVLMCAAKGQP